MSYRNDFTCNIGEIIPVYWQDLMPNSSWSCRVHGLIRFMPLLAPIMDNIDFYIHFWQAPDRILYGEEFTKMITGEYDIEDWEGIYFKPADIYNILETSYELSSADLDYLTGNGSIFDLLGYDKILLQDDIAGAMLNARKFCMYFRLLSNWYTNENIEPYEGFRGEVDMFDNLSFIEDSGGDISTSIATIIYHFYSEYGTAGFAPHLWPKDYYTSALPTLQYGLPTYLPLGESAPVTIPSDGVIIRNAAVVSQHDNVFTNAATLQTGASTNYSLIYAQQKEGTDPAEMKEIDSIRGTINVQHGTVDLSEATAITINELRVANALQVFKEREMRFGRRAPEYYKGFYGVSPGDLRLQLPKFLGGGRIPVNISDVEQTSASESGSPQGKLAGKGTAIAAGFARAHTFTAEEALVMGIGWLMPKITYANTLSRHDTKLNDRFAYYNPSFAHIGEQEVYNYEVYAGSFGTETGSQEFGYQPRYTEYRFHANEMHGDFKGSLSYWTLGRIFSGQPALNRQFVYMQPRAMQRIFVAQFDSNDHMIRNVLCSLKFSVAVLQPLSRYGTPGLLV
jgi:hypothetical protein